MREFSGEMSPFPRDERVRAEGDSRAPLRAPPSPYGFIWVLSNRAWRSTFVAVVVLFNVASLFMVGHANGSGIRPHEESAFFSADTIHKKLRWPFGRPRRATAVIILANRGQVLFPSPLEFV